MRSSDRLFFIIQSLFKYASLDWSIWIRSVIYRPFFKRLGKNVKIKDGVTIKYPSEIEIGDNCKIGEQCFLVGKGGLIIGDNCLLGAGTKIVTSRYDFDNITIPLIQQNLIFEPIKIGNGVWMGFDVKIFGNCVIEDNVVIGAASFIKNATVPANTIVAGIPARLIKKRKS